MIRGWLCLFALTVAAGAGGAGVGCGSSGSATPSTFLTRDEMIQPSKCATCHQSHFDDWTESMHAQAADDPVFIAMNKRGQRETNGTLGTFCVKCHAPMAVRDGKTTDGLNLASLPTYYKGVTCFFCHTIDAVGADHDNASVDLSGDLVMRGEYSDPVANPAHASTYSTLHDDQQKASATMCGSCHDIDSPAGGHIERTFAEWSDSAFSGPSGSTC
ncbi:MAG TPA: multiheme c-type cytochrome, partial [Polyangiaceae bacterium]|nr:multiheme c-type cytochrome [Polyangiaceae bacterium]